MRKILQFRWEIGSFETEKKTKSSFIFYALTHLCHWSFGPFQIQPSKDQEIIYFFFENAVKTHVQFVHFSDCKYFWRHFGSLLTDCRWFPGERMPVTGSRYTNSIENTQLSFCERIGYYYFFALLTRSLGVFLVYFFAVGIRRSFRSSFIIMRIWFVLNAFARKFKFNWTERKSRVSLGRERERSIDDRVNWNHFMCAKWSCLDFNYCYYSHWWKWNVNQNIYLFSILFTDERWWMWGQQLACVHTHTHLCQMNAWWTIHE